MSNIIEFKPKKTEEPKDQPVRHMFTLDMYIRHDGEYEVDIEMKTDDNFEVYHMLMAAAFKFAEDNGLMDLELDLGDDNS